VITPARYIGAVQNQVPESLRIAERTEGASQDHRDEPNPALQKRPPAPESQTTATASAERAAQAAAASAALSTAQPSAFSRTGHSYFANSSSRLPARR
jgi:hypothetical protein